MDHPWKNNDKSLFENLCLRYDAFVELHKKKPLYEDHDDSVAEFAMKNIPQFIGIIKNLQKGIPQ